VRAYIKDRDGLGDGGGGEGCWRQRHPLVSVLEVTQRRGLPDIFPGATRIS